jgi:hypothetical protein
MAGKIKREIDDIIARRSKGNSTVVQTTRTKLILKGINPDSYTITSADDPIVLEKLRQIAQDLGVAV